jgi:hypothetical protein
MPGNGVHALNNYRCEELEKLGQISFLPLSQGDRISLQRPNTQPGIANAGPNSTLSQWICDSPKNNSSKSAIAGLDRKPNP